MVRTVKLRTKLIMLFFVIFFICVAIMGLLFFYWSEQIMAENSIANNNHLVMQMEANIEAFQNRLWELSNIIAQNPDKYASEESLEDIALANRQLSLLVYYSNGDKTEMRHLVKSWGIADYNNFIKLKVYQDTVDAAGKLHWFFSGQEDSSLFRITDKDRIIASRLIRDANHTFEEKGILLLGVDISIFGELCRADNLQPNQGIVVVLDDNTPLYSKGLDDQGISHADLDHVEWNETHGTFSTAGQKYIIFRGTGTAYGCRIYMLMEANAIYSNGVREIIVQVLSVVAVISLVALLLIFWVSGIFTKPVKALLNSMDSLSPGDWGHHVEVSTHDEIGELSTHFNSMIDNLKKAVDENYVLALREREAELSRLQAQINPHFLYNTLATFYSMSLRADQDDLAELVIALSSMFRTSLSKGESWISVRKEKEFLENYLMLQSRQSKMRLEYSIDIDEQILDGKIPKLILQPFIENAVLHGLFDSEDGGTVNLTGRLENGRLVFTVTDTGVGVDHEALEHIRNLPEEKPSGHGYALWNVRERLWLYYRGDFSLTYDSEPGQGMRVRLEIPQHGDTTVSKANESPE